jgi:hypothetical protein
MTATKRYGRIVEEVLSPGEVLRAVLAAQGRTQSDLSRSTGISTKHLNQVLKGVVSLFRLGCQAAGN